MPSVAFVTTEHDEARPGPAKLPQESGLFQGRRTDAAAFDGGMTQPHLGVRSCFSFILAVRAETLIARAESELYGRRAPLSDLAPLGFRSRRPQGRKRSTAGRRLRI